VKRSPAEYPPRTSITSVPVPLSSPSGDAPKIRAEGSANGGAAGAGRGSPQQPPPNKRGTSSTVEEIKKIDMNREQRRRAADELKRSRQEEAAILSAQCGGVNLDIDFHRMIREFQQQCPNSNALEPLLPGSTEDISVSVRKRPIQQHELVQRDLDCVTACNPYCIIHERKFKVDGITKCLESHQFEFDRVFDDTASNEDVYQTLAGPLVPWVIKSGGRATVFAYGQTGSGKTHTMTGLQQQLAEQVFSLLRSHSSTGAPLTVSMSFFEIYGGRPFDLLNNRQRLETLEDARNEVQIAGLCERPLAGPEAMLQLIDLGNSLRTTHSTAINRDSSRSHAICVVFLRPEVGEGIHGKVTLVDLAGSERAADSKSTIRQRRVEGAQINKSLLALKECIRAMGDPRDQHVPFRASKLTLVLRDAFISRVPSKTVMIACISPGMSSADHSVNTLRYSDRLKDRPRPSRLLCDQRDSNPVNSIEDPPEQVGRPVKTGGSARRDSKSPEPRATARHRSPSPGASNVAVPNLARGCRPGNSSTTELPKEDTEVLEDFTEQLSYQSDQQAQSPPVSAWVDIGGADAAPCDGQRGNAVGSRQPVSRRGRQPTLRPREALPNRPDALGSRATPQPTQTLVQQNQEAPTQPEPNLRSGVVRSPQLRERSPEPGVAPRTGDLRQQDNRYLHNTLTSEVFEAQRDGRGAAFGVVDVGVEDLTDLAHMEALDEVRNWEDRVVSQHMVALQEDAHLLTVESELLSQVQQGSSYDIDWYVGEVEKVVRRRMEVYNGFLEELEVFKAQLRREENLSRSCQRNRVGSITSVPGSQGGPSVVVFEDLNWEGDAECTAGKCKRDSPNGTSRPANVARPRGR